MYERRYVLWAVCYTMLCLPICFLVCSKLGLGAPLHFTLSTQARTANLSRSPGSFPIAYPLYTLCSRLKSPSPYGCYCKFPETRETHGSPHKAEIPEFVPQVLMLSFSALIFHH